MFVPAVVERTTTNAVRGCVITCGGCCKGSSMYELGQYRAKNLSFASRCVPHTHMYVDDMGADSSVFVLQQVEGGHVVPTTTKSCTWSVFFCVCWLL